MLGVALDAALLSVTLPVFSGRQLVDPHPLTHSHLSLSCSSSHSRSQCAGLAAALAESVSDTGVVDKFRSFEQQKAKREKEIAEIGAAHCAPYYDAC